MELQCLYSTHAKFHCIRTIRLQDIAFWSTHCVLRTCDFGAKMIDYSKLLKYYYLIILKSSILLNYNVSPVHMPNFIAFGQFIFEILTFKVRHPPKYVISVAQIEDFANFGRPWNQRKWHHLVGKKSLSSLACRHWLCPIWFSGDAYFWFYGAPKMALVRTAEKDRKPARKPHLQTTISQKVIKIST